jgi:hypothetical protein
MMAVNAYFRAEQGGFRCVDPLAEWLAAETELHAMLRNRKGIKAD